MNELDLNQPAQVNWLARDEPTHHETGDPGTARHFSTLRDAVVLTLEELPKRYHESARITIGSGGALDIGQIRRIYAEVIKP
jgi:hypothetical protein